MAVRYVIHIVYNHGFTYHMGNSKNAEKPAKQYASRKLRDLIWYSRNTVNVPNYAPQSRDVTKGCLHSRPRHVHKYRVQRRARLQRY